MNAVCEGGGKVDNEEELKTSLSRSTFDIIKIGDRYGSIEKYPHIKRGGKTKKKATNPTEQTDENSDGKDLI